MKILFVCRGNVGRSQMAEAFFNKLAPIGFSSISVGTKVSDKEGNSVDGQILENLPGATDVITVMEEEGIDLHKAVRNQITEKDVTDTNLIVIMADETTLPKYLLESEKIRYWNIEDPKSKSMEEVRITRDTIKNLVKNLLTEITS